MSLFTGSTSGPPTLPPPDSALLQGLNAEQRAAVALPREHALILAGAGSGKTRVLTTRIAWLLQSGQCAPAGVLAVTFTNKAAKEMLTRLSAMLPVNVRGMWIGTFHGLCNRFLRAHWKLANLPQSFQILDTQDQLSAIKRLYKQFSVDDERFPPKQTQWFIAACKEDGLRPADVEARDADAEVGEDEDFGLDDIDEEKVDGGASEPAAAASPKATMKQVNTKR
jgi:DNA helicase-2/ATP-dependent DNA helicase PcrA